MVFAIEDKRLYSVLLIVIFVYQIDNNFCTMLNGIRKFSDYHRIFPFLHYPCVPKWNLCNFCTS